MDVHLQPAFLEKKNVGGPNPKPTPNLTLLMILYNKIQQNFSQHYHLPKKIYKIIFVLMVVQIYRRIANDTSKKTSQT